MQLDRIYCGDSLVLMKEIPDDSVDVVLTSPPRRVLSHGGEKDKRH